jgi:hypothetical protein
MSDTRRFYDVLNVFSSLPEPLLTPVRMQTRGGFYEIPRRP